jgi:hypothetical protein
METAMKTTLRHNARSNGLIEIFCFVAQAELKLLLRRSNHVSAWRGRCRVRRSLVQHHLDYCITQLDNERQYERAISNLLPWRATSSKCARNAQFDADYDPFIVGEFVAVRDEPKSSFFLARVAVVQFKTITVYYSVANLPICARLDSIHLGTVNTTI